MQLMDLLTLAFYLDLMVIKRIKSFKFKVHFYIYCYFILMSIKHTNNKGVTFFFSSKGPLHIQEWSIRLFPLLLAQTLMNAKR